MDPTQTLVDYRTAFWLTFAEDNGLINEWQLEFPSQISDLPDIKAGTTLIGLPSGVGLPG